MAAAKLTRNTDRFIIEDCIWTGAYVYTLHAVVRQIIRGRNRVLNANSVNAVVWRILLSRADVRPLDSHADRFANWNAATHDKRLHVLFLGGEFELTSRPVGGRELGRNLYRRELIL